MNNTNSQLSYSFTKVQDDNAKDSVEVYLVNFMNREIYVYVDREAGTIEYDTDGLTIEEDDELFCSLSEELL